MSRVTGLRVFALAALGLLGSGAVCAAQPQALLESAVYSTHGHGTAVAVSLRLAAGAQDDPMGREGAAVLLAQILENGEDSEWWGNRERTMVAPRVAPLRVPVRRDSDDTGASLRRGHRDTGGSLRRNHREAGASLRLASE